MNREQLQDEIVRLLRALRLADEHRAQALRRDLAEATVALREHFLTPEGNPDWSGSSGHYRTAMRGLYSRADYSPEERRITQSTVRYHIGNIVRERLSTSELQAAGLTAPSPHERQRTRRKRTAAIMAATAPAGEDGALTAAGNVGRLGAALALVAAVQRAPDATPATAAELIKSLDAIERETARIRRYATQIIEHGR